MPFFSRNQMNRNAAILLLPNELVEKETKRKFGNSEFSDKPTNYYNLDVIISVGYRVKSPQGTKFRIWANKILKDFLIKGYAINEQRLQGKNEQFAQLKHAVKLLDNVLHAQPLTSNEATGLLEIITDYNLLYFVIKNHSCEKDDSFQGSLAAIYQTFGGQYLYPSVEEKAAK